jgi:hypothetical protein
MRELLQWRKSVEAEIKRKAARFEAHEFTLFSDHHDELDSRLKLTHANQTSYQQKHPSRDPIFPRLLSTQRDSVSITTYAITDQTLPSVAHFRNNQARLKLQTDSKLLAARICPP